MYLSGGAVNNSYDAAPSTINARHNQCPAQSMPGTINVRHNQCPAQSRRDWATNHQHPQSNSVPKNDAEIHGNPTIFDGFGRQNLPRLTPRRHREAGRVPGGSPEGPWGARGSPKASRSRPLDRPRSPKGGPRIAQSHPRGPRSTPERGKSKLKRNQDEFQTRCPVENRFFVRFCFEITTRTYLQISSEL